MKKKYSDVLELVRAGITETSANLSDAPEWDEICPLLIKGKLFTVAYRTVASLGENSGLTKERLSHWQRETFAKGVKQLQMVNELRTVLTEAQNRKIRVVVFKGITLAALYPEPYTRLSCDADLLVRENQREAMEQMLVQMGYEKVEAGSKEHVPVYAVKAGNRQMKLEIHDLLWEDYEGKQAKILRDMRLDAEETLIGQEVCGIQVTTLGYNEHLIYQMFHIVKHFFFEGIPLRYFTDIALYIDAYADRLDFVKVRKEMERLHYGQFFDSVMKICYQCLGMKTNVLGDRVDKVELNERLLTEVLEIGRINNSVKQWESINFLSHYFMRTSKTKTSNFQQRRKQILPMPSELNDHFSYAKKCPFLLPVAWIHRVFYMLGYARHCKRNGIKTSESLEKAQYRLDLMRELGLTETDKEVQDLLSNED